MANTMSSALFIPCNRKTTPAVGVALQGCSVGGASARPRPEQCFSPGVVGSAARVGLLGSRFMYKGMCI